MRIYFYTSLIFIVRFYLAKCTLPNCEQIVNADYDGHHNCIYCYSPRISDACIHECRAAGCINDEEDTSVATTVGSDNIGTTAGPANNPTTENPKKDVSEGGKGKGKKKQHTGKGGKDKKPKSRQNNERKGKKKHSQSDVAVNSNTNENNNGGGKCDNLEPCVEINEANAKFQERCKQKGFDNDCWKHCRYNVTKKEIQTAFTHDECDIEQAREFLYAAANNKDNSYCCNKKHYLDGNQAICEPFCNPGSSNWPDKPSMKYLTCLSLFDNILKCHWASCRP